MAQVADKVINIFSSVSGQKKLEAPCNTHQGTVAVLQVQTLADTKSYIKIFSKNFFGYEEPVKDMYNDDMVIRLGDSLTRQLPIGDYTLIARYTGDDTKIPQIYF